MSFNRGWLVLALVLVALAPSSAATAQGDGAVPEPDSGAVVCAPSPLPGSGGDCLVEGPAAYLQQLAIAGLEVQPSPLPASKPDPNDGQGQLAIAADLKRYALGRGLAQKIVVEPSER